jgi:thiol-disulfide isomerase/thioredoxin
MLRSTILLAAVLAAGCGSATSGNNTGAAKQPTSDTTPVTDGARGPAADDSVRLTIVNFDGIQGQIAKHKGQVVVMDAWSTSCPPCMKEFHNLVELSKQYSPEQVDCISLSFDYEGLGKPEDVQANVLKFLRSQGATFTNLLSNEESDVLYRKFKLAAVPAVFVYDQSGQLAKRFDNEQAKTAAEHFSYAQVGELVARLLAEKPAESK